LSITRIAGGASSSLPSGLLDGDRDVGLHAAQLVEEVDVEVGAAELAVGDALEAHVLLEATISAIALSSTSAQLVA
jgi:hypothetical protein